MKIPKETLEKNRFKQKKKKRVTCEWHFPINCECLRSAPWSDLWQQPPLFHVPWRGRCDFGTCVETGSRGYPSAFWYLHSGICLLSAAYCLLPLPLHIANCVRVLPGWVESEFRDPSCVAALAGIKLRSLVHASSILHPSEELRGKIILNGLTLP